MDPCKIRGFHGGRGVSLLKVRKEEVPFHIMSLEDVGLDLIEIRLGAVVVVFP